MVRSLGATETTADGVQLFSGDHQPLTMPCTIEENTTSTGESTGTALQGLVLGRITATGNHAQFVPGNADGTEVADRILATEEVECDTADCAAESFVHGEFNEDALDWGAANAAQIAAAIIVLEAKGIYVKPIKAV